MKGFNLRGLSVATAAAASIATLGRVAGNPRPADGELEQSHKPVQPAPPASDVPAAAPTMFDKPVPSVKWPAKTGLNLQTLSEALGEGHDEEAEGMDAHLVEGGPEPGESHVKTPDAVEHDLSEVSESLSDTLEEHDDNGTD